MMNREEERRAFHVINDANPDGWEYQEPTDADRDAFRRWALERYGRATWDLYRSGGMNKPYDPYNSAV